MNRSEMSNIIYGNPHVKEEQQLEFLNKHYLHLNVVKDVFASKYFDVTSRIPKLLELLVASGAEESFDYIISTDQFKNSGIGNTFIEKYREYLNSMNY